MREILKNNKIKRFVIITGMSGAGKSSALNVFEDQGFYVIDNLPLILMPQLIEVLTTRPSAINNGVAAVVDVRGEKPLIELKEATVELKKSINNFEILFVEASDECLVRRFETTRRRHPMAKGTTLLGGITREKELLGPIRNQADIIIDTSEFSLLENKKKLLDSINVNADRPIIVISSFGFKYGLPHDADYILDVRFLNNPNYVNELKHLTGKDKQVLNFLKKIDAFDEFIDKAEDLFTFVAPIYSNTGKKQLHIAIGCTGGRHRSVAIVETLASKLLKIGNKIVIEHRDIGKENH